MALPGCAVRQVLDDREAVLVIESLRLWLEVYSQLGDRGLLKKGKRMGIFRRDVRTRRGTLSERPLQRFPLALSQEHFRGLVPGMPLGILGVWLAGEEEGIGSGEETADAGAGGRLGTLLHHCHTILFYSTSV